MELIITSREEIDEAILLKASGLSWVAVADRLHISAKTMQRALRRHGIQPRNRDVRVKEARFLRSKGMIWKEVARLVGYSDRETARNTARRSLQRGGGRMDRQDTDRAVAIYRQGATFREISAELRFPYLDVKRAVRAVIPYVAIEDRAQRAAALRAQGYSWLSVARMVGYRNRASVRESVRAAGIQVPAFHATTSKLSSETIDDIVASRARKEPGHKLAERLGLSARTVYMVEKGWRPKRLCPDLRQEVA